MATNSPVQSGVYKYSSPGHTPLNNLPTSIALQGANKEDLLDQIVMIDPFDTPWVSQAPKTTARNVYHQWVTDTLGQAVTTDGAIEGGDWSYDDVNSAPAREWNTTVILRQDIGTTESQRAVDSVGFADAYAYEMQKATKRLAIKLEKIVLGDAAQNNGTSGNTARQMKPLRTFITAGGNWSYAGTNAQGKIAGQSTVVKGNIDANTANLNFAGTLTSGDFNDMLETIYRAGGNPEQVYVSPKVKRQISAFTLIGADTTSPFTRNIAAVDKKLISTIDFYDTDFGIIQIVLDRWVPEAANTTTASASETGATRVIGTAFFLQRAMNRLAWLRPMTHQFIGKRGDAVAGLVVGECTLEVLSPKANGAIYAINNKSSVT